MAYNEEIADRIRIALSHLPNVEEKKMFGELAFMVDDKMCITAGDNKIMCRINPEIYEDVIEAKNCVPVIMKGKELKGYVQVHEENIKNQNEFDYWISMVVSYNKIAKSSKKH